MNAQRRLIRLVSTRPADRKGHLFWKKAKK